MIDTKAEKKGTTKAEKKKLKKLEKERLRRERKKIKRKKKNALVVCQTGKEFWTTQDQFWQWVREKVVVKSGHNPLRGKMIRQNEETAVVISNNVLNLACPNHLKEVLHGQRYRTK